MRFSMCRTEKAAVFREDIWSCMLKKEGGGNGPCTNIVCFRAGSRIEAHWGLVLQYGVGYQPITVKGRFEDDKHLYHSTGKLKKGTGFAGTG